MSDVAFGKVATHNFLGRDVEKYMEYHGKNFPVNKAWVPTFFMIPGFSIKSRMTDAGLEGLFGTP